MLNELPVIVELREILFNYSENPVFFICLFVIIPTIVLISIGVLVKIFSRIRDLEKQVKTKKMREISELIQEGAKVYLKDQRMMLYKLMAFLIVPVGLNGLDFLDNKILSFFLTAIIFSLGCMSSLFASYIGMRAATKTNILVVEASIDDPQEGFKIAYMGGMVTGILNITMFVVVIWLILMITGGNIYIMVSFDFGASVAALLAQVGGGIFTKSADMGADLVGKYENDIAEDDPRNPAIIADLVGDNVGDCAGRGADLFESASSDAVGGMLLGLSIFLLLGDPVFIILNLTLISLGLLSLYFTTLFLKIDFERPSKSIWSVFGAAISFNIVVLLIMNLYMFGIPGLYLFASCVLALFAVFLVILVVPYYTSAEYAPTKDIMESSNSSPSFNIVSGLTSGFSSVSLPIILFCVSVIFSFMFGKEFAQAYIAEVPTSNIFGSPTTSFYFFLAFGIWGVNMASVSSDVIISTILSFDTFGPIMDNAAGITQIGQDEAPKNLRKNLDILDSVGNTTKAIAKGFALVCGGYSSLVMFLTFLISATSLAGDLNNQFIPDEQLENIFSNVPIYDPLIILGFCVGILLPVMFSARLLKAVKQGAQEVVAEVQCQFEEIDGLREGRKDAVPDYNRCIDLSTKNALKNMFKPVLMIILVVLVTGILFGPMVIAALLIGNLIGCMVFGFFMSVSGGAWDNAKKAIEDGAYDGKGSFAHKSAILGDTIGDPLKDCTGPSMNIIITTINTLAITFLPIFINTGFLWQYFSL